MYILKGLNSIMTSYKKINMLDLTIENEKLIHNEDILTLKTPIIIAKKDGSNLLLKINNYSESHGKFMNLCGYINTLYNIKKIKTDIMLNGYIILKQNNMSRFFDENKNNIAFNKINAEQKIICTIICDKGNFIIEQGLIVK
jgi:hypothetical protein